MNTVQTFILVFSVLQSSFLWSSAPEHPIKLQRTDPVSLRFNKADIQALGWKGQSLYKVQKRQNTIQIERKGFGKLPTQLIIIPRDRAVKPHQVSIEPEKQQVTLTPKWEKLSKDEVFIWGETPSGVCHRGPSSLNLVVSNPRKAQSFSGAFLLSLNIKSPNTWVHLNNSHGKITKVESEVFEDANEKLRSSCHIYHGGPCDQVFTLVPSGRGQHHEIEISKIKKNKISCPI